MGTIGFSIRELFKSGCEICGDKNLVVGTALNDAKAGEGVYIDVREMITNSIYKRCPKHYKTPARD